MPDRETPPTPDQALARIKNTWSTRTLMRQADYIRNHTDIYGGDMDRLLSAIENQFAKMNIEPYPENCERIEEIEVTYSNEGNAFLITPESRTNNLEKYCTLAHLANKRLLDYIVENTTPEPVDIRIKWNSRKLVRNLNEQIEPEAVAYYEPPPERHGKEISPSIDISVVFRQMMAELNERFAELERAIRENREKDVDALIHRINALEGKKDQYAQQFGSRLNVPENEIKTKEFIASSPEYNDLTKAVLNLPPEVSYSVVKLGRGEYRVSFRYQTSDQLAAIDTMLNAIVKASREREQQKKATATQRMSTTSPVIQTLCRIWMAETGNPNCGLSQSGALRSLAERIIDFIESLGPEGTVDIQNYEKYIEEIDLFANKGQKVYTNEQADEAFNVFVRAVTGDATVRQMRQMETIEECDPMLIMENLITFDEYTAIESMLQEKGLRLPAPRKAKLDDAIVMLRKCGVYPNNMVTARQQASSETQKLGGMSYEEYLDYNIRGDQDTIMREAERA